jgi:hypothetical protein
MAIHSRGYVPENIETAHEKALFLENLSLILQHQQQILACPQYFFCTPSFAWCSWPYVGGDGPIPLGYLLLGWSHGLLTEPCPSCQGRALVTSFGGSPLSGSCAWTGLCQNCCTVQSARGSVHRPFHLKIEFISKLRSEFPQSLSHWEDFDGHNFSWGGNGLQPARKARLVQTSLATGLSIEALIEAVTTSPGDAHAQL